MMPSMTVETRRPPYAGWRAAGATALVMPGAIGAHTWAGGHVPGLPMLSLLTAVMYAGSLAFLRTRLPAAVLLPAGSLAQAGLHAALVATTPSAMPPKMPAMDMAAHAHQATGSPWSGRMLLAHVLVTVLTAVVWRLCQRAGSAVLTVLSLLRTSYVAGRRDPRPPPRAPRVPHLVCLVTTPWRGPPVLPRHA